jgi:hypothetical protein
MTLLLFACVVGSPPTLQATLQLLDRDLTAIQAPDLSKPERARLLLEMRSQAARLRAGTGGKPDPVRQQAIEVERDTAKLIQAIADGDEEAISRREAELSMKLAGLRVLLGQP